MRPLFAAAVPTDADGSVEIAAVSDRAHDRREERYLQWRRTRVLFMQPPSEPDRALPTGDLPRQRTGGAL